MNRDAYLRAIEENSLALAAAARGGLDTPIPTCPGWTMADLVVHLGFVQRGWTWQVANRLQEPGDWPLSMFDPVPGLEAWFDQHEKGTSDASQVPSGVIEWFEDGVHALLEVFRAADPDEPVWHWSGDHRALSHGRNQAFEALIHRWDAENARGEAGPINHVLAVDGLQHYFTVVQARRRRIRGAQAGRGETFHFHCTDGDGEWVVRFDGADATVREEHGKGDIALRGRAADLLLWAYGRTGADRLDVVGDRTLLDRYLELTPPD